MQLATLIISATSLVVSTATLVVVVVALKKAEHLMQGATGAAQEKIEGLKRAVADL